MIEQIKQELEAELESLGSRTEARMGENHHDETGKLYFLGGKMAAYEKVEPWLRYLIGEVERLGRVTKGVGLLAQGNSDLISKNHALHFQVEELQKALEWYADEANYEMVETQVNAYSTETTSATWTDSGERARTALERSETK